MRLHTDLWSSVTVVNVLTRQAEVKVISCSWHTIVLKRTAIALYVTGALRLYPSAKLFHQGGPDANIQC